jgi:hypothetical protein
MAGGDDRAHMDGSGEENTLDDDEFRAFAAQFSGGCL